MPDYKSKVEWTRIDQQRFDRIVEALLVRRHQALGDGSVAEALDGRGGDGGHDVDVTTDDKLSMVYQLKYFPEGFSGGHAKSRKPQIRRSFNAAMKDSPPTWALVLPRNPTPDERTWVRALGKGHKVRIEIWGSARLDQELARFPDLAQWAVRDDEFRALMVSANQEKAALLGPDDLRERARDLGILANSRSEYWAVSTATDVDGTVIETLAPKRHDAADKEPINLNLTLDHETMTAEDIARFERLQDYGIGEVILTETAIKRFEVEGPEWIAGERQVARFEARPMFRGKQPVVLSVKDADGNHLASVRATVVGAGPGARGSGLEVVLPGGGTMTFLVPHGDGDGQIDVTFSPAGVDAQDARDCLRFFEYLDGQRTIEVRRRGEQFLTGTLHGTEGPPSSDYVNQLVDDLAAIADHQHIPLDVPTSLSAEERFEIRRLRLILEGYVVLDPAIGALTSTLSGDTSPEYEAQVRSGFALAAFGSALAYSVCGHEIVVPGLTLYCADARVVDAEAIAELLHSGGAAGHPITIRSASGRPFSAYLPDRMEKLGRPRTPVALNVPGHPEPVAIDAS